ncbi:MAG: HNH endonuclease [Thermomicrobiales bacterium]
MCGCGRRTTLARQNDPPSQRVKGKPVRYLVGHSARKHPHGYTVDPVTDCWNWNGATNKYGYGVDGLGRFAHIVVYEAKYGPVSDDLELDHLCRNHRCCNPDHVEPVTHAINSQRGANAKLTADDIPVIRALVVSGMSQREIGNRFDVSNQTISKIVSGKRWRNV